MTERLRRIATRMRQELAAIERLAVRAARAMELARQRSTEQDFYFLRFRHVVRNVYAFEFDGQRLGRLVEDLGEVLAGARTDLLAFAEFLERLASGEER